MPTEVATSLAVVRAAVQGYNATPLVTPADVDEANWTLLGALRSAGFEWRSR